MQDASKQFPAVCRGILSQREQTGVKRLRLKGHPTLEIGDFTACLDTNNKLLLVGPKDATDKILKCLTSAPGHRWVYSSRTFFGYFCFVVTTRCSLHCQYCFAGTSSQHHDLSPALARKMAKEIPGLSPPNQYPRVYFFGGEPTLNLPAIDALMDELDRLDVDYIPKLLTNGLFDTEVLSFITDRHMIVQFSHDGVANSLRMTPSQERKLLDNIQACADLELPIIIRPTISALNVEHLTELLEEAYSLAGDQLMSINFGVLNLNKGAAQKLSSELAPDPQLFAQHFEAMIQRARELGVRISSIPMSSLRRTPERLSYLPCFVSTEGLMSVAAVYDADHTESQKLVYGHFDTAKEQFIVNDAALRQLENNYRRNDFLHNGQACFAQALCGGLKKSIKNCRQVYDPDHIEFFKQDRECAVMRSMTEIYIVDFLKVFGQQASGEPVISFSAGIWSADVGALALSAY